MDQLHIEAGVCIFVVAAMIEASTFRPVLSIASPAYLPLATNSNFEPLKKENT
jgi:hypothetical protein